MLMIVPRTISSRSTQADVVTSPAMIAIPVLTSVSQATRAFGSSARIASRTASEIWSAILSGCPSDTDSEVNTKESLMGLVFAEYWQPRIVPQCEGSGPCAGQLMQLVTIAAEMALLWKPRVAASAKNPENARLAAAIFAIDSHNKRRQAQKTSMSQQANAAGQPARRDLANAIRALSMDAVQAANSGHPGAPMGMADIAQVLWNDYLKHNPANPRWPNRDRFVLSNGHGSMLLYSLLHLSGYDLPMAEIENFRQLHSKTPGHPEYGFTPGVETTTGPLGQGLGNAVGMALAEKVLAAQFNKGGQDIVDHKT